MNSTYTRTAFFTAMSDDDLSAFTRNADEKRRDLARNLLVNAIGRHEPLTGDDITAIGDLAVGDLIAVHEVPMRNRDRHYGRSGLIDVTVADLVIREYQSMYLAEVVATSAKSAQVKRLSRVGYVNTPEVTNLTAHSAAERIGHSVYRTLARVGRYADVVAAVQAHARYAEYQAVTADLNAARAERDARDTAKRDATRKAAEPVKAAVALLNDALGFQAVQTQAWLSQDEQPEVCFTKHCPPVAVLDEVLIGARVSGRITDDVERRALAVLSGVTRRVS